MHVRVALWALTFATALPLAVALAGELPAAHGTEIEGPCGDQPCEEAGPQEGGPCGDQPCEEAGPQEGGPCGDQPCEEAGPQEGGPCGDQPCEEAGPQEGGPCGDQPCEEADGLTMDQAPLQLPKPAAEPDASDDGYISPKEPAGRQITPGMDDTPDPNVDEAGAERASSDRGSFPTAPVAVGLAAMLLIVLAFVTARRRRR